MIKIEYSLTKLRKRLFASILLIAFLFCLIFARFFYVQIIWGEELQQKAVDQWTRELPIIAERGVIKDRNGVILVDNKTVYSVFIRPRSVSNPDEVADVLSNIFGLDRISIYKKATTKTVSEYTVVRGCDREAVEKLSSHDLSGVYYSKDNERTYPYGDFLTQVLGYVSCDS